MIRLNKYSRNRIDFQKFRKDLYNELGREIFQFSSIKEVVDFSLGKIEVDGLDYPKKGNLSKIEKILEHYKLPLRASIEKISNQRWLAHLGLERAYSIFNYYILNLERIPKVTLQIEREDCEADMNDLLTLLKFYEQIEFLKIDPGRSFKPNNVTERKLLDFYFRVVQDQKICAEYFFSGVFKVSIEKSKRKTFLNRLEDIIAKKEKPYEYGNLDGRVLDYRKINCSSHRHRLASGNKDWQTLYLQDKQTYYQELFRENTEDNLFENLILRSRALQTEALKFEIIEEMRQLFNSKQFYGLYSLLIPHVEGVFNELLQILNLNSKRSLSDKIRELRGNIQYQFVESWDYFEYIVAEERNQYLHTGRLSEPRLKALDALTDLEYIVDSIYNLKHPAIKMRRILEVDDNIYWNTIDGLGNAFYIFNSLSKNQKARFKGQFASKLCSFQQEDLNYIVQEYHLNYQEKVLSFFQSFNDYFASYPQFLKQKKYDKKSLLKFLQEEQFQKLSRKVYDEKGDTLFSVILFFEALYGLNLMRPDCFVPKFLIQKEGYKDLYSSFQKVKNTTPSYFEMMMCL